MTLYALRAARVRFAGGGSVALPDVTVAAGDRVAVVGPNGAGKTTLLRVLGFLATAEGGFEASVGRGDVTLVAQRPYLFRGTVAANLALALAARGVPRAARRTVALAALERLGGRDLVDRPVAGLSAGELHRAALARALAAPPRVVLLDEPLGPLDGDGASRLAGVIAALDGVTMIAAAPDTAGIPFDASRIVRLTSG